MAEFGLYVVIRQLVNGKEWLLACEYLLYEVARQDIQHSFQGVAAKECYESNSGLRKPIR